MKITKFKPTTSFVDNEYQHKRKTLQKLPR
jgi:hypothetical protein